MNLVEIILKEHSAAQKDKIVRYVGNDQRRFAELVRVFLGGPYRVTQRAGWPLSDCVKKHPELIKPHLKAILLNVTTPGLHDAVKRNTVRLMQFITIPKNLQGLAVDTCFRLLSDTSQAVAVRCFSMTVLCNIACEQPALRNEIIPVIEDQLPFASAGFLSRAKRTLKLLEGLS